MALVDQNRQQLSAYVFVKSKNVQAPRATLASFESLTFPLVQKVVILADFRCERCQKRVADIISRTNGETKSVEVSVLEKKVTLTFKSTIPRVFKVYCMLMRVNIDCNACCRKMRRILLNMKEIEKHLIEKQHYRVTVYGRFVPADVAIKIRRKMKRRVEILQVHDMNGDDDRDQENSPDRVQPEMQYA